jgi:hypothetical protein
MLLNNAVFLAIEAVITRVGAMTTIQHQLRDGSGT